MGLAWRWLRDLFPSRYELVSVEFADGIGSGAFVAVVRHGKRRFQMYGDALIYQLDYHGRYECHTSSGERSEDVSRQIAKYVRRYNHNQEALRIEREVSEATKRYLDQELN